MREGTFLDRPELTITQRENLQVWHRRKKLRANLFKIGLIQVELDQAAQTSERIIWQLFNVKIIR
jgi:hypothetical protein